VGNSAAASELNLPKDLVLPVGRQQLSDSVQLGGRTYKIAASNKCLAQSNKQND